MDTNAAVRRLEASGFTREQAEAVTAVMQEAVAPVPTTVELSNFVLQQDLKLERVRVEMHQEFGRLRSDMQQEFGRVHATLAGITAQLQALRDNR